MERGEKRSSGLRSIEEERREREQHNFGWGGQQKIDSRPGPGRVGPLRGALKGFGNNTEESREEEVMCCTVCAVMCCALVQGNRTIRDTDTPIAVPVQAPETLLYLYSTPLRDRVRRPGFACVRSFVECRTQEYSGTARCSTVQCSAAQLAERCVKKLDRAQMPQKRLLEALGCQSIWLRSAL